MAAGDLQFGLTDLSEHGAVLECGECMRAVVVPRDLLGERNGLRHVSLTHHTYESPEGGKWNEMTFGDERGYQVETAEATRS